VVCFSSDTGRCFAERNSKVLAHFDRPPCRFSGIATRVPFLFFSDCAQNAFCLTPSRPTLLRQVVSPRVCARRRQSPFLCDDTRNRLLLHLYISYPLCCFYSAVFRPLLSVFQSPAYCRRAHLLTNSHVYTSPMFGFPAVETSLSFLFRQ